MAEKLLAPNSGVVSSWTAAFLALLTEGRILFPSRSNQHKLQVTLHSYTIALFALAQVAEMGHANSLHLNEICL